MTMHLWESGKQRIEAGEAVTIEGLPHAGLCCMEPLLLAAVRLHPDGFGMFFQSIRLQDTEELVVRPGTKGVPAEIISHWFPLGSAPLLCGGRFSAVIYNNTGALRTPTLCAVFTSAPEPRRRRFIDFTDFPPEGDL